MAAEDRETKPEPEAEPAAETESGAEAQAKAGSGERAARRRALVGALVAVVGATLPFLVMASDRRWGFSVPVGLLGCALAAFGILDALGTFDDPEDRISTRIDASRLGNRLLELLSASVAFIVALRLAISGVLGGSPDSAADRPVLPILGAAVLVTGTFFWGVVALYRTADALGAFPADAEGRRRSLLQRHGFWLIAVTTLVYLPLLGSFSLSDPWETHYGEVAREMLARDDWISLWWAQDGFFFSKPVLTFWLEGLCFSLLGVPYAPDQMIASVADGRFPQPEWAARIPVLFLTLVGTYLLYKGVARAFGRRAALLGALVLVSTPYWYLLAHQSMTDMVYVGPLSAAMGLFLLGFAADPDARVRSYPIGVGSRTLHVSGYHLLFGLILLCVLPQLLYLASRNLTLQIAVSPHGFRPHLDEFFSGSGMGNCGLPGNQPCRDMLPVHQAYQPVHGALLFAAFTGVLLWSNRHERRQQRLYFLAAWFFVVLSAMAKGAPGLVLGLLCPLVFIGATRRWRDLERLELPSAVVVFACVLVPWWAHMYVRHGHQFMERLLWHDMYKRAFTHVHDTNQGVDTSFRYYVWQLGYGLFPWTGLGAGGLLWFQRHREPGPRRDTAVFLLLWFVLAFCMFAISGTKFHHYVFPAVPPIAMLTGLLLDDALGSASWPSPRRLAVRLGGALLASAAVVYGVSCFFPGSVTGYVRDNGALAQPSIALGVIALLSGVAIAVASFWSTRAPAEADATAKPPADPGSALLGAVGIAAAVVLALIGRDLVSTVEGDTAGNARLMHLISYNYGRPWPQALSYDCVLIGFTIVAALLCALLPMQRFRRAVTILLCSTGLLWGVWGVDVYLVNTSPHWGQRETVMAYYLDRSSPEEPFVAYQMNWKGENFYTGNRVPAWVASGQKFKEWIRDERARGVKVMYFSTEHSRTKSLKRELGNPKDFEILTTEALNNKFMTARVRF